MVNALLPLDNFVVINKTILNSQDRLTLTLLYQPIVGSIAVSLYLTLWSFLDRNKFNSLGNTHNDLAISMQLKLDDIKEAKDKLEAIGLIKTYLKKGEVNSYIYELYGPLSAYEFFNNPILDTALYNNLNKKEYKRIVDSFSLPKVDLKGYQDISCSFKDVYNFVSTEKTGNNNIKRAKHLDLSFEPNINFNEVLSLIPEELLNIRSISKDTKELIYELAFIYDLGNDAISEIIKNSLVDRKIDINLLKENCRSFYKFEHKGKIPKIVYQNQPQYLRQGQVSNTKKSKLINQFETTSPYEFLSLKQDSKPTEKDMEIIEYLMIEQKLNPGVVNVLLDYVLKINNNKLVRKFVEQIAVQWKRSKIETVSDAIDFARSEYDKKNNKPKTNKKIEAIPSWFNQDIESDMLSDEELEAFEKELER